MRSWSADTRGPREGAAGGPARAMAARRLPPSPPVGGASIAGARAPLGRGSHSVHAGQIRVASPRAPHGIGRPLHTATQQPQQGARRGWWAPPRGLLERPPAADAARDFVRKRPPTLFRVLRRLAWCAAKDFSPSCGQRMLAARRPTDTAVASAECRAPASRPRLLAGRSVHGRASPSSGTVLVGWQAGASMHSRRPAPASSVCRITRAGGTTRVGAASR